MSTDSNPSRLALSLPTLDKLGATIPTNLSPSTVTNEWLQAFSSSVATRDNKALRRLFVEDAFWKDILALTWDFRSIQGLSSIRTLFSSCVKSSGMAISEISQDPYFAPALRSPFPNLSWVQFGFDISTNAGKGQGYVCLIPQKGGAWKAYTIFTSLESLGNAPLKATPLHKPDQEHHWQERRAQEIEFVDSDPTALVIGAGHSSLELAARLRQLNVPTLVVERTPRVGDNWRNRYKSLCLHDPVFYNQLPYLQYPSNWPVYTPKAKLADWLEAYAHSLEINVWTSTNVKSAQWDTTENMWHITLVRGDGGVRSLKVKYLVFANGLGGGVPVLPDVPGKEKFNGEILHSSAFFSAKDYVGKKMLVVGACNSGHDIAQDAYTHGVDVMIFQRSSTYVISAKAVAAMLASVYSESGPPVDMADRLNTSFPLFMVKMIYQRVTARLAASLDKEIREKLVAAGFRVNLGPDGAGLLRLFLGRGGRYYVDVSASTLIAEKKIGLKSGGELQEYTSRGVKLMDGTELEADVIVFATGFGDSRALVKELCGTDVTDKLGPVWGVDSEGELKSAWRDSGHPHLYFAVGNFAVSQLYSHYLALQIKAQEGGVFGPHYSL